MGHKEVLWEWQVREGSSAGAKTVDLPSRIITYAAGFQPENLAPEISMLLPTTAGTQQISQALIEAPHLFNGAATGLLMSDPTINIERIVKNMRVAKTNWLANLPTIGLHEVEFKSYLDEVGIGVPKEFEVLARFRAQGMKIMASLTDVSDASAIAHLNPDAVLILPDAFDFLNGWPSLAPRQRNEKAIRSALIQCGWGGPCLGYRDSNECNGELCVTRPRSLAS